MRALIGVLALVACGGDDAMLAPDAAPVDGNLGNDIAAVPGGCVADRASADRADDHRYDQIRVLYVVPSDSPDAALDTSGKICNSARAFAAWFHARAGSYLRFDTQGGLLDIGFVRLTKTDAQMRGTDPNNGSVETGTAFVRERIELELQIMGQIATNKLYAVYYAGSSVYACGGGAYPPLIKARVGAMYLGATPPGVTGTCGDERPWGADSLVPNYVDYGMLHELVHSLGIVVQVAPHQHASGHVFDGTAESNRDLMYSPRIGQNDPGWGIDHPDGLVLDIGNDDYFMSPLPADLAKTSLVAPLAEGARPPVGW